ncbi:threonine synthase [Pelagibacteraceae bacterium]|jgi:threonine synthase|nr:threonine synthase [Pelagibacteraceae bacterium]MDB9743195.1 threonine synthase [Pelagibacteraceae bacterium]MDC0340289.1 threonine synthase [Pelagibacteraceae bacterium]MDC0366033.1 threonine synthase [Pelagibacteraceae bacterium]|tara:strand:- start:349 stop:1725 length:1377 start_codon:yes stop_codon:yes gene_type:complete
MKYFSTRDKSLEFSFKDIFLRGLAPEGGLFLPSKIKKYNGGELKNLSKLSYVDLATEIIFNFCQSDIGKKQLKSLIKKAYDSFKSKEVVEVKKVGNYNLLELYHGPTLAFKDIAMQVIGNMYDYLKVSEDKVVNIIVATSGDTGAAAISALNDRNNINVFILHPHNKISNIQRKIMTTIGSNNIFNIAVKGSFDDCQKIVKDMFNENDFREKINMSGVNSINWARIICQIVYYFYSVFKINKKNISFSVPTGNFGDAYAGYMAKKMGLPIDKLIIATNENNILQRVINTGEYKPGIVKPSLSPSMDIQISSNFERLLFDILGEDDKKVALLMNNLKTKGFFKLDQEAVKIIKKDFCAEKINDKEVLDIIKNFNLESKFILDPHTATAFGAVKKIKNLSETIILGTAHPYKFLETVKKATGIEVIPPSQLSNIVDKEERFDILDNNISKIKNYILEKTI